MADDFAEFDDDDFLVEDEEESSNRPFILAVMGLVGVLLITVVVLGLYMTFAGGSNEPTATEVANEVNAEQAATATHISATNEAILTQNAKVTQTLEARQMTDEAPAEMTPEPEPEVTEEPDEVAATAGDIAEDSLDGEETGDASIDGEGDNATASDDGAMDEDGVAMDSDDVSMDSEDTGDASMDGEGDNAATSEDGSLAEDGAAMDSGDTATDEGGEESEDAEPNAAATSIFNGVSTVTPESAVAAGSDSDDGTADGVDSDQSAEIASSDSDASAVVGGSSAEAGSTTGTEAIDASQEFATLPETGLFSTLFGSIGAAVVLLLSFVGARRLRRED